MSQRLKAAVIVTALLYGTLMYSVFVEPAFWVHAFGPAVSGVPISVAVAVVVTLLYLPVPWIIWHGIEIFLRARDTGMPLGHIGIFYTLFTIGGRIPELRWSQRIVMGGLCYFLAVMAAWIWYADAHGL